MDSHEKPPSEPQRLIQASLPHALHILRKEYIQHGKKELYEGLLRIVSGRVKSQDIATKLGVGKNVVLVAVCRFQKRLGELLRKIIKDNSRDGGTSGSALLPVPKHPLTPHGSTGAEKIPEEE